jgi:DnaK suppressor protein
LIVRGRSGKRVIPSRRDRSLARSRFPYAVNWSDGREVIVGVDAKTLDRLRADLIARKAEIEENLDSMAGEIRAIGIDQDDENGGTGNHMAEDGSNVAESERLIVIGGDLHVILQQVDSALARMDDGSYGLCQRCGKPINPERLEAFPYVAYDIECQSIIEREQELRGEL